MLKALLEAICEDPEDHIRKLILADYYEENGDKDRSDFWRWCAKEKKRPDNSTDYEREGYYFWFYNGEPSKYPRYYHEVSVKMFRQLNKTRLRDKFYPECCAYYSNVKDAYEGLYLAWLATEETQDAI